MFEDYLSTTDAARVTQALTTVTDTYTSSIPYISPFGPALVFVCGMALLYMMLKYKDALTKPFSSAWMGFKSYFGGNKMDKEREREQDEEFIEEIVEFVESKVSAEVWTRTDADRYYYKQAKIFPVLRFAVHVHENVKEMIKERILNTKRDARGKVIPLPLPGEKPARKKIVARLRG